jgi:hypothetical protein
MGWCRYLKSFHPPQNGLVSDGPSAASIPAARSMSGQPRPRARKRHHLGACQLHNTIAPVSCVHLHRASIISTSLSGVPRPHIHTHTSRARLRVPVGCCSAVSLYASLIGGWQKGPTLSRLPRAAGANLPSVHQNKTRSYYTYLHQQPPCGSTSTPRPPLSCRWSWTSLASSSHYGVAIQGSVFPPTRHLTVAAASHRACSGSLILAGSHPESVEQTITRLSACLGLLKCQPPLSSRAQLPLHWTVTDVLTVHHNKSHINLTSSYPPRRISIHP